MSMEITRRVNFCAAHRLHNPELSDEENRKIYGECNNPYGHGHNYVLEVTISGAVDPKTGMIMNLQHLNEIIQREIVAYVDHRHFNFDVPFTKGINPSLENLLLVFWSILDKHLPNGLLKRLRLWETENNSATYTGPS